MKTIKTTLTFFSLLLLVLLSAKSHASVLQFKSVAPIVYSNKSGLIIRGDSINGGSTACIHLMNCSNITIVKCKLQNTADRGVRLDGCSNITIDSCYFNNVSDGIYAFQCTGGIKINYNQFTNITGPAPRGHAVQLNTCSGGGNTINYNWCDITIGSGSNPNPNVGDIINVYKSNGISGNPIRIYGNALRGGSTAPGALGTAGIVVGDVGGSFQDVEFNTLVNTGYVGIQMQGGTHIYIMNNKIYSDLFPWSGAGLVSANYSGVPSNNNTISGNLINWQAGYMNMKRRDTVYKAGSGVNINSMPAGWSTNTVSAPIKAANLLPAVMINPAKIAVN